MKKIILLFVLFTIFHPSISYGQACGGGLFKLEFYSLNGTNLDLTYEILEIDEESYPYTYATFDEKKFYNGLIVNMSVIKKIKTNENSVFFTNYLDGIDREGEIIQGRLTFPTTETYSKLYVLKVISKKQCFFIIADLFGGCNRKTKILLEDEEAVIVE